MFTVFLYIDLFWSYVHVALLQLCIVMRLLLFEICLHNFSLFYFLLMMDVAEPETFQNFAVSNKALLFKSN